jgi:hypothetical protein
MCQGRSFGAAFETTSDTARPERSTVQRMKRSAVSDDCEQAHERETQTKRVRRTRRVHWADDANIDTEDPPRTEPPREPPALGEFEKAMFVTSFAHQNDALVRPTPILRRQHATSSQDAKIASTGAATAAANESILAASNIFSLSAHVSSVVTTFKRASADFEKAKSELHVASKENAPESTMDRLERRASVLDALHRRAFEDAFLVASQAKVWPFFLVERVGVLAGVIRYNRTVNPGELGVSPAFALHALRCANWRVLKNAHGTASILPTGAIPGLELALW